MKKPNLISTLTVLGVSAALFATPAFSEDAPGEKGKGKGDPTKLFENADKNADGKLSEDEVPEQAWARLSKADADNDGGVTREELATAMKNRPDGGKGRPGGGDDRPEGKGKGKGDPKAMFERSDANKDGKLTEDEVPERAWAFISKADADEDGAVTQEEMAAAAKNRPEGPRPGGDKGGKGGQMFDRLDKDADGKITEAEAPAEVWARLSKADTDNDGAVSKEEAATAMRQMGDRGGKGGKGGPGSGGPGAMFGKFDENKDEKLSESEVPGEVWAKLRNADTDADGFVSKEELGKVYGDRGGKGDAPKPEKPEAKKKRPEFEA